MPTLLNARHEAFARTRAKGARLEDAYGAAGYTPSRSNGSTLAARPEVADRIAELRAERDVMMSRIPDHDTIVRLLMETYARLKDSADARLVKEARLHLFEAMRLSNLKIGERDLGREKHHGDLEKSIISNV